jgi:uncharacterized protein (DUF58 family)
MPVVLGRHRLYILPTGHGLLFALTLALLLLAAVNYQNGLVYLLTFALAAVGLVSMLHTHRNLARLAVLPGACAPVFAGEPARFSVCLMNDTARPRHGLRLSAADAPPVRLSVPAHGQACAELRLPTARRGRLAAPPFTVATDYPLGLLYSWSRPIRFEQHCLVYPRPAPPQPWSAGAPDSYSPGAASGGEDFVGLAPFRHGDSPHHISWKAVARGQGMLVKRFGGGEQRSLWLDWDALAPLATEERLSRLCRAVLDAEAAGHRYGLRLPQTTLAPDRGETHRHACLRALALFPA